jgi:hypothetical protein
MEAMASGSSSACSEDQSPWAAAHPITYRLAFIDHKPSAPGLILYAVAKTINYLVTTGTRWWAAYHGVDTFIYTFIYTFGSAFASFHVICYISVWISGSKTNKTFQIHWISDVTHLRSFLFFIFILNK